jgi:hypothetical protein
MFALTLSLVVVALVVAYTVYQLANALTLTSRK